MDYIFGPFEYSFMVRALIVSVLVGVMCPILGAYVITRGRSFMGDALAHSVLPAMVVAFLLGISPFFAAVPAGILIALLMGAVSRRTGVSEDTSIGIIFAGMFALGLVMLSSATNINVDIEDLLLGQVLGVSQTDVYVSLGLTALVLVGLYAFHRQLVYTTFDAVGAAVVGIKTRFIEYVLLALLALVIVIGIQAAGIVLVMAMLITPAAAGYMLARRFVGVMGYRGGGWRGVGDRGSLSFLLCRSAFGPRDGPGSDRFLRRVSDCKEAHIRQGWRLKLSSWVPRQSRPGARYRA